MEPKTCKKCRAVVKSTYIVALANKLQADFCDKCCDKWFDLRDAVVEKAFKEYLGK